MKTLLSLSLSCLAFAAAAVPLKWTVDARGVVPAAFEVVRGETIELEAALNSYGKPLEMAGKDVAIYWQTNGMLNAWWSAPATAASNTVAAVFTPAMDPGAAAVNGFIGVRGENYRAAFVLRFRHGPGEVPNELELPRKSIDFSTVEVSNAPWAAQAEVAALAGSVDEATNWISRVEAAAFVATQDANDAKKYADDANTTASSAQISADKAQTSADKAQTTADNAQSTAEAAQAEVAAVRTVMAGEDFRITITNYDSKVHAAVISMEARYSDGTNQTWATVWNETNGLARTKRETLAEVSSNYFDKATADGRYKAWGNYDSQTGEDAPEGFVQVSAPGGLVIGADAGWKNYLSASGGSYWVWRGNGNFSTSQETGTLSILDADGNAALTVVKGDKTLESATAASIAATSDGVNDIVTLVYVVDSAEAPTVEYSAELKPAAWYAQTDDGFPGTVEWTSEAVSGGTQWTATVTVPANGRGFFRASYWKGAESYVNYNKPMAVETFIVDGVRYAVGTAEINGVTVLSLSK